MNLFIRLTVKVTSYAGARRQGPGAVRRKSEGKVLVMVITDAGQIVKNGAPEDLLHIR